MTGNDSVAFAHKTRAQTPTRKKARPASPKWSGPASPKWSGAATPKGLAVTEKDFGTDHPDTA